MPASEQASLIKLISASTGRVVKTMSGTGVGNIVALAPDMRSVFTIPLTGPGPRIYQVQVSNGHARLIGTGSWPAPSPDSQLVAYAAGTDINHHVLAVLNLRTGRTLRLDLSSVIGGNAAINNPGTLTWLGDGTQLVVLPEPAVYGLLNQVPPAKSPRVNACGQQRLPAGLCVFVVTMRPHQLVARPVVIPGWRLQMDREIISGDLTSRQSFLIARPGSPAGLVDEVSLRRGGVTVRRVASLLRLAAPLAIAPDGDRIVYQPDGASTHFSGPIWLWVAPMTGGRLGRARLLFTESARFQHYQVSW